MKGSLEAPITPLSLLPANLRFSARLAVNAVSRKERAEP